MCYELKILDNYQEISQYEYRWVNLELNDSECTIFQSYNWIKKYCDFLLSNKKIAILLFFHKNILVGIFPMQIRFFRETMIYEFMGSHGVDYLMPLIMDLHKENLYLEFCNWMENQNDNVIFAFEDVPQVHSFSRFLRNHNSVKYVFQQYDSCPYYIISLPESWEKYKESLSKRMRHDIEYDRRYIKKNIRTEFKELSVNRIDEHIMLNKKRMHARQLTSPFDFEAACLFWKEYFNDEYFNKRLKIYALISGSEIVASIISLTVDNRQYILSLNINLKYKKYSPGNVLLGYMIETSINEKIKTFDLGRGRDSYKLRFGAMEYMNDRVIVCINAGKQKQYNSYVFYLYNKIGYYLTDK